MKKPIVGQEVWVLPSRWERDGARKPYKTTVSKVGRMYFYTRQTPNSWDVKYHIDTGIEETNTNYATQAFATFKEIENIGRHKNLLKEIGLKLSMPVSNSVSLDQLIRIKKILNE